MREKINRTYTDNGKAILRIMKEQMHIKKAFQYDEKAPDG